MAENNNSLEMKNTATESILLGINANSTPRTIENKISEDLFTLISDKFEQQNLKFEDKFNQMNSTFNVKLDSFENELKKQNKLKNIKLDQVEEKLDKRINEIELENKSREIDKLDGNKDKVSSCLLYTSYIEGIGL